MVGLIFTVAVNAEPPSYHFANPVGMMYDLPVGEVPGWSSKAWVNLELSASNIWNRQFTMTDIRNGNTYTYFADYEQETAIADVGFEIHKDWALSFEIPYANHNGGFMDDAVDRFHQAIGSDRFLRDSNPKFGNHFLVQTNGVNTLATEHAEGVGNIKAKLKYWAWHLNSPSPGTCECGLAFSAQAKFPMQTREHGLTSGHNDYSGLIHLGVPFGSYSGAWATAAFTKLGANDTFAEWPRRDWQQMYEISLDLGTGPNFGIIFTFRNESPLFEAHQLSFNHTTTNADDALEEEMTSGYGALVHWRGSEDIGVRWRWGKGSQINFMFVEDWNIGNYNHDADGLYINNAPDYEFVTQLHFTF